MAHVAVLHTVSLHQALYTSYVSVSGVALLQVSAFYVSPDPPKYLVRFCFCKTDDKLTRACDLLEEYFK